MGTGGFYADEWKIWNKTWADILDAMRCSEKAIEDIAYPQAVTLCGKEITVRVEAELA